MTTAHTPRKGRKARAMAPTAATRQAVTPRTLLHAGKQRGEFADRCAASPPSAPPRPPRAAEWPAKRQRGHGGASLRYRSTHGQDLRHSTAECKSGSWLQRPSQPAFQPLRCRRLQARDAVCVALPSPEIYASIISLLHVAHPRPLCWPQVARNASTLLTPRNRASRIYVCLGHAHRSVVCR